MVLVLLLRTFFFHIFFWWRFVWYKEREKKKRLASLKTGVKPGLMTFYVANVKMDSKKERSSSKSKRTKKNTKESDRLSNFMLLENVKMILCHGVPVRCGHSRVHKRRTSQFTLNVWNMRFYSRRMIISCYSNHPHSS